MASALYLEQYLDSIENLPFELQRNFTLMRELDQRSFDLLREIDQLSDEYLGNVNEMGPVQRTDQLKKVKHAFQKSHDYSDDKVNLAMQTYEMVDKHIRRLDADLARFEAEIKNKEMENLSQMATQQSSPQSSSKKRKKKPLVSKKKSETDEESTSKKKKKKLLGEESNQSDGGIGCIVTHSADVLDMPVDPNEPTYCLCHQVSYGEMIGCDNPECPIEWFHFACVGLTSKPKGKWFCQKCNNERRKK